MKPKKRAVNFSKENKKNRQNETKFSDIFCVIIIYFMSLLLPSTKKWIGKRTEAIMQYTFDSVFTVV